jgi:transcriptional regulator with XRE-family HTH domain
MSAEPPLDFDEAARDVLLGDEEYAVAYLRQGWISAAVEALVQARRRRGLSQREVAERLGVHQSAIARLENDDEGHITLARYADYALALDSLPYDLELAGLAQLRTIAYTNPDMPRTVFACQGLMHDMLAASPAIGATTVANTPNGVQRGTLGVSSGQMGSQGGAAA